MQNLVGQSVARLRRKKGWTQDELASKLQLLGCCMTRDMIAKIEARCISVTDKEIMCFAEVFGLEIDELFPRNHSEENGADF